ncbi:MAG: N-acetylmannosamine-6-phosphate 2-epimerase [Cyanobacteriota bacterium]
MKTKNPYYSIIEKLRNKIIVSCQASANEPFYADECMIAMVKSVIIGGAGALRLAGARHIKAVKSISGLPVIGITKPEVIPDNYKEIVYITPAFEDAKSIRDAGCDIIAIDSTERKRPRENLKELIDLIHNKLQCPVMADISTYEEGINSEKYGVDIISTTLAGYTTYSNTSIGPDFELLKDLVNKVNVPVILEGRIESVEHVKKAFDLGAYAVVIGSAITRPHLITKKFVNMVQNYD